MFNAYLKFKFIAIHQKAYKIPNGFLPFGIFDFDHLGLFVFDNVAIEHNAFSDIFHRDMLVCSVDGSKLLFAKIDGRKAKYIA